MTGVQTCALPISNGFTAVTCLAKLTVVKLEVNTAEIHVFAKRTIAQVTQAELGWLQQLAQFLSSSDQQFRGGIDFLFRVEAAKAEPQTASRLLNA